MAGSTIAATFVGSAVVGVACDLAPTVVWAVPPVAACTWVGAAAVEALWAGAPADGVLTFV